MTELAYDERTTPFNTTNNQLFATSGAGGASPVIGGLDITLVGTGQPVEIEFYAPAMGHSAQILVSTYFIVTRDAGAPVVEAATSQYKNWATAQGEGGTMRRRLVLANGSTYLYQVGVSAPGTGIATVCAQASNGGSPPASTGVMHLRATQ
jgi:hypothetical protein